MQEYSDIIGELNEMLFSSFIFLVGSLLVFFFQQNPFIYIGIILVCSFWARYFLLGIENSVIGTLVNMLAVIFAFFIYIIYLGFGV
jgi:hypothetical protein